MKERKPAKAPRKKKRKGRYHRGIYISKKTGQECKFRSGWEEKYMVFLDSSPDVLTWSYESLSIDYVSNKKTGKLRRYIPDFQVTYQDGRLEVIEIKPQRRLTKLAVRKKLDAAQIWCSNNSIELKIITEIELKNLGIL
jgi:hypothetical protein